jgi:hypothetical protein
VRAAAAAAALVLGRMRDTAAATAVTDAATGEYCRPVLVLVLQCVGGGSRYAAAGPCVCVVGVCVLCVDVGLVGGVGLQVEGARQGASIARHAGEHQELHHAEPVDWGGRPSISTVRHRARRVSSLPAALQSAPFNDAWLLILNVFGGYLPSGHGRLAACVTSSSLYPHSCDRRHLI